jgi:hypothetical protein
MLPLLVKVVLELLLGTVMVNPLVINSQFPLQMEETVNLMD